MKIPFMQQVSWCLVFAMFLIGIAPRVEAGFSPSEAIALAQVDRGADMDRVQKVLESKMIQERLGKLGLTQDEINSRLSRLSDQQVHQLALQLDDLKVGGDGLGLVIALLVVAILIVILFQLTGHRVLVT